MAFRQRAAIEIDAAAVCVIGRAVVTGDGRVCDRAIHGVDAAARGEVGVLIGDDGVGGVVVDVAEAHVAVVYVNATALAVAIIIARGDIINDGAILDGPVAAINSTARARPPVLHGETVHNRSRVGDGNASHALLAIQNGRARAVDAAKHDGAGNGDGIIQGIRAVVHDHSVARACGIDRGLDGLLGRGPACSRVRITSRGTHIEDRTKRRRCPSQANEKEKRSGIFDVHSWVICGQQGRRNQLPRHAGGR